MNNVWIRRWQEGRIGWHESAGNADLRAAWPTLPAGTRVLVPLCGKALDLLWLAKRGLDVSGVELSEIAIRDFFAENEITFTLSKEQHFDRYTAQDLSLTLYRGDFFNFQAPRFDALYDRGALITMPIEQRRLYVGHVNALLQPGACKMIITLEYDQDVVAGPPFSTRADEVGQYWDDLICVKRRDDIDNCPPKFRAAGLKEMTEVVWLSTSQQT